MVWSIYSLYVPHYQENVMLTFQTFSDNMKLHIYRNSQKNVDLFGHLLQETPCGAIPRKRPRDMTKISILDGSLLTVR